MIYRRVRGLTLLHTGVQSVLALLLFWLLVGLHFGIVRPEGSPDLSRYAVYSLAVGAGFVLHLVRLNLADSNVLNLDMVQCYRLTLREVFHVSVVLLLYLVAAKDQVMSRAFLFTYLPLLYLVLFLSNRRLPAVFAQLFFHGRRQQRTLLLGDSQDLGRLRPWLQRKATFGMQVLGFIPLLPEARSGAGESTAGSLADLERLVTELRINQVILTRSVPPNELITLSARCENAGTRLLVLHDLEEQMGRPLSFIRDDGFYFISMRQEPLECPLNRLIKRTIDVAVALPVVVFLLPWTSLAVWLIHRLQSPGSLFFRQPRTGLHNEEFCIFKYRTMHMGHGRDAEQARIDDDRIFPLGRWLRKLSIDELPQFINVLKGEMSIVGPRPHLSEHDEMWSKIAHFYRVRSFIKPGITGLAQVRGLRGESHTQEQVRDRLQSDLYYLENWSPSLDWLIILRTAWQVVRPPRSAY